MELKSHLLLELLERQFANTHTLMQAVLQRQRQVQQKFLTMALKKLKLKLQIQQSLKLQR